MGAWMDRQIGRRRYNKWMDRSNEIQQMDRLNEIQQMDG